MSQLEEIVDLSLEMGGMMLESNSEIYRCEMIVYYFLKEFGINNINIFTLSTSIYLTASLEGETITKVKRVYHHSTNLERISDLNQLSRDLTKKHYSLDEIKERLAIIKNKKQIPDLYKSLTISLSCMAFGYMFVSNLMVKEAIVIFIITFLSYYLNKLLTIGKMNIFNLNFILSIFMTTLTITVHYFGIIPNIDHIIIGTIMYLVPGVALTNSTRDMLNGDILSGTVRLVECLIVGLAIAAGVFMVLFLYTRGGAI